MWWIFLTWLAQYSITSGVIIRDSVVFHKTNDVTLSRARWLGNFVIDLQPVEILLNKLKQDISNIKKATIFVSKTYDEKEIRQYSETFRSLEQELGYLNTLTDNVMTGFNEINKIHSRSKRSLLPFIGKAASWLFGLVSDDDVDNIKKHITTLDMKQNKIIHVVKESLSILNATKLQVYENRHAINELIVGAQIMEKKIEILNESILNKLERMQTYINLYIQIDMIVQEIRLYIQNGMFYLNDLSDKIGYLTMNKLTPNLITPSNLRSILFEIQSQLPTMLKLLSNPDEDLWIFYQYLSTTTFFTNNKIVVVLVIPLLRIDNEFKVYKAMSLPIPFVNLTTNSSVTPDLIVKIKLESNGFLIDKHRTKYVMLNAQELKLCSAEGQKWCDVKKAVMPVTLSKLCIVNMFLNNTHITEQSCQPVVSINTRLPIAQYLINEYWAIASKTSLQFSLICNDHRYSVKHINTKEPVDIVQVKSGCELSNQYLTLSASYHHSSVIKVTDNDKHLLHQFQLPNITALAPIRDRIKERTQVYIPSALKDLEFLSLDSLINQLPETNSVITAKTFVSKWRYVSLGLGVTVFAAILTLSGVILYYKVLKVKFSKLSEVCYFCCKLCRNKTPVEDVQVEMSPTIQEQQLPHREATDPNERPYRNRLYPVFDTAQLA